MIMVVFVGIVSSGTAYCGDLDDNIPADDKVSSYDEIGNTDQNKKFIKMNAKSNAKRQQKQSEKGLAKDGGSGKGGGAMNSVVMGPGSNVKGDIIIIDESKGDKTQVVE